METTIDKFQEIIDKLKMQSKTTSIPKIQFTEAMIKMNESVERTREEYLNREDNTKSKASGVIVR